MASPDVDRILTLINSRDIESLKKEDFDIFQYQGFDPYRLLESLIQKKNEKSISDDTFSDDVCKMVAIGLIKGNVNPHNMTKMTDAGKSGVENLIKVYGLKMGGGKNQSSSVVTFPRVMACFPDIAVRISSVIGGKEFRGGPMSSSSLPNVMQVQVFPSVIPLKLESDVKEFFKIACLCYSIDQTIQISQNKLGEHKDKDGKVNVKAISDIQSPFVNLSHTSPVPKEDQRIRTFNSLGLPGQYRSIRSVVDVYVKLIDPTYIAPDESTYKRALSVV